nr:hypothetical protein EVB34_010 [Rhizobium phage RHph_TM26]
MTDSFLNPPNIAPLIGKALKHNGNGKTYVILDLVWSGESDQWGYLHRAVGEDGPKIWRPMSHLNGTLRNGAPRYEID